MKLVAVQGCTLTTDNATAQATIIDAPSMKVKAEFISSATSVGTDTTASITVNMNASQA